MCEQTEISYLDGDVVWVKLGASWWPGQVTSVHNLPEDIQEELKKKPIIAAVKFFQEDTYEYVKNYQQIYKYNCTLKDDFIKKGLDKYRTKSKDGSSYMDKFPGDVEMAEKLTGGDADIISSHKFTRQQKPDISALFGEKKVPKKKRDREDGSRERRNDSGSSSDTPSRKITHPRFLKESDHEVRIRHQPPSLSSTPSNSGGSPQYTCYVCSFTSSRLNVIILHNKTHSSGNSTPIATKVKTYSQPKAKLSESDTPKRKYTKKDKGESNKARKEIAPESGKRKSTKHIEKASKKKKPDPQLREKLLADWQDESDTEMGSDFNKSADTSSLDISPQKSQRNFGTTELSPHEDIEEVDENEKILSEAKKILNETESLSAIALSADSPGHKTKKTKPFLSETQSTGRDEKKSYADLNTELLVLEKEGKNLSSETDDKLSSSVKSDKKTGCEKDDKKSKLSCFDFDEEDLPEPAIPPVRKIPRVFGDKNLSLKKEIIKEFEMSQALKNDQQNDVKNYKDQEAATGHGDTLKHSQESGEIDHSFPDSETRQEKMDVNICQTELEIVEIFEVEKEEDSPYDETSLTTKSVEVLTEQPKISMDINEEPENSSIEKEEPVSKKIESDSRQSKISLEIISTDTEKNQSSTTIDDLEAEEIQMETNETSPVLVKKRRGRPRKNLISDKKMVRTNEIDESKSIEIDKVTLESSNKVEELTEDFFVTAKKTENEDMKAVDSDVDISQFGRKRRSGRKSSKTDAILLHTDHRTSNDDSQSELDDKSLNFEEKLNNPKKRAKKGRRPSGPNKKSSVVVEKSMEIDDKLTEELADSIVDDEILSKSEEVPKKLGEKTEIDENSSEFDKKLVETPEDPTEDRGISSKIHVELFEESTKPTVLSVTDISKEPDLNDERVTVDEKSEESTLPSGAADVSESSLAPPQSMDAAAELINRNLLEGTESKIDKLVTEFVEQKTDGSQNTDISKIPLETLPPKKSQIKKFEMSQSDFFDNDTSVEKIVTQPEPEKKRDKIDETEIEITRVDESETVTLMEKVVVEQEIATSQDEINPSKESMSEVEEALNSDDLISKQKLDTHPDVTIERNTVTDENEEISSQTVKQSDMNVKLEETLQKDDKNELEIELVPEELPKTTTDTPPKRSSMQTRYKGKFTPETGAKSKKDKDGSTEEKPINTFQEAFLKTLHIDNLKHDKKMIIDEIEITVGRGKKSKKSVDKKLNIDVDNVNIVSVTQAMTQDVENESVDGKEALEKSEEILQAANISIASAVSDFRGVEVVVEENTETNIKLEDPSVQELIQQTPEVSIDGSTSPAQPAKVEDVSKVLSLDVSKLDETSRTSMSTPSPTSVSGMPVKKREKPRIIESVSLKEPMHILKSKLLEKIPSRGTKHKLEPDTSKRGDSKHNQRTKIMKIENLPSNSKLRQTLKISSPHLSLTQKLEALKAEEAAGANLIETQTEKVIAQTSQSVSATPVTEKLIQQSSQSLADMELDINSMPFVLSEDVLTPESIEQMPVVITSLIPGSSSISTSSISLTPTTQLVSPSHGQFKTSNESTLESTPSKKKSGVPTILKTKAKAKPTITSVKTIVPPLTGGVKGLKFQNAQTGKNSPLISQKGQPGKYVIVQTAGGQQLRYSVQGKPGSQQKIAIPTGKGSGSAQIVQQGGKVVILTSPQSGQTKMIPLNTSKTIGTKMQRIMTTKGQIFAPISSQGVLTTKTIIAPKTDVGSPTTSKVAPQGQKIISTQGLSAKGVLTQIPGAVSKSTLLGTLTQGIITKGGIYTPISAASLAGKTIISSKTLVTTKGTTILSPLTSQNLVTSKGAILAPISHSLTGKTILSTQGIVGSKGTVLTPITGQQVKAIAAKSPSKGAKVQYQTVQQKMHLPVLQKNQKVPISSSQMRVLGSLKSPGSTILLQNTVTGQKTLLTGKKMIKQALAHQQAQQLPVLAAQSGSQQASPVLPQQHMKGKILSSTQTVQKVVIPRTPGRQSKTQQKIVVQKMQDASLQSSSPKLVTNVSNISKSLAQTKQISGNSPSATKASAKSYAGVRGGQQKRNLLNAALNSISSPPLAATVTKPLSLPTLEQTDAEKKPRAQEMVGELVQTEESKPEASISEQTTPVIEKIEEPKAAVQPQIMALPTESGDGTQTYVLVTIDEQGQIQPLDNNTLMSLEGTTQNPDGTRTLYIDPNSLGEAGTLDNIVLQFDNGCVSNLPSTVSDSPQTMISESFPSSEIIQTSNQDILAAALANTDFQQEIGLPDNSTASVMSTGLTQTSLINQTILQSTIIPPTEPISSPAVLETSLTLNQPIMTPLEVPSNMTMTTETSTSVATIPSSLELPLTVTNPSIAYISTGATQIQMPGNSMPDIGEIMDNSSVISHSETPATTQYLVLPNLDENITIEAQDIQSSSNSTPTVSYSVSIPENMVLETTPVQTTPSMPIIDDTYADDIPYSTAIQTSLAGESSFVDVPVSEMLVSKASVATTENIVTENVTVTSEMIVTSDEPAVTSQELIPVSTVESQGIHEVSVSSQDVYTSHDVPATSEELISQQTVVTAEELVSTHDMPIVTQEENHQEMTIQSKDLQTIEMHIEEHASEIEATSMPLIEEPCTVSSESNVEIQSEHSKFQTTDSKEIQASTSYDVVPPSKLNELLETSTADEKPCSVNDIQTATSNEHDTLVQNQPDTLPAKLLDDTEAEHMDVEPALESASYVENKESVLEVSQGGTASSEGEHSHEVMSADSEINFEESVPETSEERPSQSYEQFDITMTSDSLEIPSQSVNKSENSPEPTQSISYESMEIDETNTSAEPPTQSFEDSKQNEATQSYETSTETHGNAPTQSFNEIMHNQEERNSGDELVDDQSFPTQSYEVEKLESLSENMETDAEMSQEGNIPSQSNDIGTDGIGTSSISTNNSGVNEDETASSSYVPETPENQERDQDQESAISTSSYEIPPCEELNIASSSVIPDTSVRGEHTSIHDNGVPEIPTSSYSLNPDSSSTHVDAVPTSSYEDQVILEQNVSTSYEVPISMPGLEENSSQSFVTESSDHRNEPSSYYTHHQEVTASYYESVHQECNNSRLEEDPQEEVTASYYESTPQDIASEASQSYFAPEEATPSYSSQSITPSYYNARPESEATQSFYSSQTLDRREQSSQNVEASQSFYPEVTENLRLRQQGEATPTYSTRYPVDYTLTDSPIERHDLVESSVPATRPTER
ncbi:mucin-17-like [Diprion similis]|uniref:mucin-17-like n=1 Tax=Diprion similis TaxID=362088 RepID=UPI001EF91A68|nr:mucin-17-like [Diprion similis]